MNSFNSGVNGEFLRRIIENHDFGKAFSETASTLILKSAGTPPDSGRMPSKNQPCGDRVLNPPKKETENLSRFTRIPHKAMHQDGTTCETQ
jgi:hypothetical protein